MAHLTRRLTALAALAAVIGSNTAIFASIITLTDGNSTATIDPTTQAGMNHWDVQGQNELLQQWFWYRVGNSGPESSIDTIAAPVITTVGTNQVTTTYDNGNYGVRVTYQLTGGTISPPGSHGIADIAETITIFNHTANPLNFHLFQYSDFDLDGPGNDTVTLTTAGSPARYVLADQNDTGTTTLSETVATPKANHGEAGLFPSTLNKLNDGLATTLNDNLSAGPGDATWALEWDYTGLGTDYGAIAPGGSQIISKDKYLDVLIQPGGGGVPEPASLGILSMGLIGLALRRRRGA